VVIFHVFFLYYLDQQTSKKKVVLANDLVFSQLTCFGADRGIQLKRPKMAEIWIKSSFLCVSMVSNPITSLSLSP